MTPVRRIRGGPHHQPRRVFSSTAATPLSIVYVLAACATDDDDDYRSLVVVVVKHVQFNTHIRVSAHTIYVYILRFVYFFETCKCARRCFVRQLQ